VSCNSEKDKAGGKTRVPSPEKCSRCFEQAQASVNKAVYSLEKLRIIYKRTKTYTDKAISVGDTAAGIHAVTGLAWQSAKRKIVESMQKMDAAFEAKKPELMQRLRKALDEVSDCEKEFFSNPDWYNRFGFMYYQFKDGQVSR
jgi:hypothetical protein